MGNVKKFEDFLDKMQGLLDNAKKQGHIIVRIEDLENAFPELREEESEEKPNGGIVMENFDEGDGFYKVNLAYLNNEQVEEIEELARKWNQEAESEDERIREEIINYFQCQSRDEPTRKDIHNKWIAWLEKQGEQESIDDLTPQEAMDIAVAKCFEQGEQKPAEEYNITGIGSKNAQGKLGKMIKKLKHDNEVLEQKSAEKVEPKFKVGDWINGYYTNYKVLSVNNEGYVVEDVDGNKINILFENEKFHHLWTIKDAKDGDVLVNSSNIFIFHFINDTRLMGYCHVNTDGMFYDDIGKNECFCLIDAVVNPATKEQRETLMKAMADAGYTFDFEKRELKKIEQTKK